MFSTKTDFTQGDKNKEPNNPAARHNPLGKHLSALCALLCNNTADFTFVTMKKVIV